MHHHHNPHHAHPPHLHGSGRLSKKAKLSAGLIGVGVAAGPAVGPILLAGGAVVGTVAGAAAVIRRVRST